MNLIKNSRQSPFRNYLSSLVIYTGEYADSLGKYETRFMYSESCAPRILFLLTSCAAASAEFNWPHH